MILTCFWYNRQASLGHNLHRSLRSGRGLAYRPQLFPGNFIRPTQLRRSNTAGVSVRGVCVRVGVAVGVGVCVRVCACVPVRARDRVCMRMLHRGNLSLSHSS